MKQAKQALPLVLKRHPKLSSWLKLNKDNTVTVFTGKVELGQGIKTALAQIVAEELELAFVSVNLADVSTRQSPDEGYTAGSASLEQSGFALRLAASQLRENLKEAAAKKFKLDKGRLKLKNGLVWQENKNEALGAYAHLIDQLEPDAVITGKIKPGSAKEHRQIGKNVPRQDIPAKVRGEARFIHDLQLPDMVHGRILRAPDYAAKLKSLEPEGLELPGLLTLKRKGDFVGLIAEHEYQVVQALEKLAQHASWQTSEVPNLENIHRHLLALPAEKVTVHQGFPEELLQTLDGQLKASYAVPYQAHASVAPSCAIALSKDDHLIIWTHSQGIYPLRRELAKLLDRSEDQLTLIHQEGPGCYGHNGADDVAADAALLALALPGRPVRVLWTLEQELQTEPYTPAMQLDIRAGFDQSGRVQAWEFTGLTDSHVGRPGGQGDRLRAARDISRGLKAKRPVPSEGGYRNASTLYDLGEAQVTTRFYQGPLRVSALRTLGAFANTFANESFMDELAYAAQIDPVAFRLMHLEDARAKAVIQLAAEKATWQSHTKPSGKGQGIAFARYKNVKAYVAQIVELKLNPETGTIKLEKLITACDAGQVINPDGLRNQLEGGAIQGISRTLFEEVQLDREGKGMQDWDSYKVIGFEDIPQVHTFLIDHPQLPSLGAGEASTPPMAAAIANALYDVSGIRLRKIPFTPERIRQRLRAMTEDELEQVILK